MKSPAQLANLLARQWLRADWREQQLLSLHDKAWPLRLRLGEPDPSQFRDDSARVQAHVLHWRGVSEHGPGAVLWRERQYRDGASPVSLPVQWTLCTPSDLVRAIAEHGAPEHKFIVGLHQALGTILQQVNACFRSVLVRKLALWRHLPPDEVVRACAIAMQLAPGCARGKPLRALQLSGSDTKFFERNERLLTVLADERFDGEVSQQGLVNFLGADPEGEHWLLVVPLTAGLLPFARLRVAASELALTPLPGQRILLVENERCLHLLQGALPLPQDLLGRQGVDVVDRQTQQLFFRVAVEVNGGLVDVHDRSVIGIDQHHYRRVLLKELAETCLALDERLRFSFLALLNFEWVKRRAG